MKQQENENIEKLQRFFDKVDKVTFQLHVIEISF